MNTLTLPDHVVVQRKTIRTKFLHIGIQALVLFVFSVGFATYGYLRGIDSGKAFERERLAYTPTRVIPATPLTQWQCSSQEAREYANACASRLRMEKVK